MALARYYIEIRLLLIKGDKAISKFQFLKNLKAVKRIKERADLKIRAKKLQGSFSREPLFYLTITSIICLFLVLCFGLNSFDTRNFSVLRADIKNTGNLLFAEPARNFLVNSPGIALMENNSIIGVVPPASVSGQVLGSLAVESKVNRNEIIEHIVTEGESLSSIAENYEITLETVLWANDLTSKSVIRNGQKLVILPVSGAIHYVEKGETISEIGLAYKGDISEIVEFNGLSDEGDIFVGDILIIPNGKKTAKAIAKTSTQIPIGSSYFICPLSYCKITQGLHYYNAIDFGASCGSPIYAAAAGVVQRVAYGWNYGGGSYVKIEHPNGVVTYYGHIQKALVLAGQKVSQGDIIALVGGKPGTTGAGISTGCHVHFDVRGAKNPFAK